MFLGVDLRMDIKTKIWLKRRKRLLIQNVLTILDSTINLIGLGEEDYARGVNYTKHVRVYVSAQKGY